MKKKLGTVLGIAIVLFIQGSRIGAAEWPLADLVEIGHIDEVKARLSAGTPVNQANDKGVTALMAAAGAGSPKADMPQFVKLLIESGANLALKDSQGRTALHFALDCGHRIYFADDTVNAICDSILELLIAAHSDLNAQDAEGVTPLLASVWRGKLRIAKLLINAGASGDVQDKKGWTALLIAIDSREIDWIKLLLPSSRNLNTAAYQGQTPLTLAAIRGNFMAVKMLVDAGADVNVRLASEQNRTPLMLAVSRGRRDTVEVLINAKADLNARDNTGLSALQLTYDPEDDDFNKELYDILKRAGATCDAQNDQVCH